MRGLEPETMVALLQAMPWPTCVYHASTDVPEEMRLVAANDAMSAMLDTDLQRAIGCTIGELFAASLTRAEGRARIREIHRSAVQGTASKFEAMGSGDPRLNGWYRMRTMALPGRRTAVILEDITDTVEQAEQLRIWSGLARQLDDSIVVARVEPPGRDPWSCPVIAHNAAAGRLLGIPDDGDTQLGAVVGGWLSADEQVEAREAFGARKVFEWHRWRGERAYRLSLRQAGGLAMFSATDATEDQRLREELDRNSELLARSNAELESFAYVVSHDLQAPLRSMAAFSDLLARRYADQLDERGERYLGHIADGARRMRQLITDLLVYSRVGRDEPEPAAVDMDPLAARVIDGLRAAIDESDGVVCCEPLPTVHGVASQLEQLLQNLVENGLKYHRDGVAPRVDVRGRQTARAWRIEVEDNGIGIPAEHRDEAFDPLRRLPGSEGVAGTGIGLSICRRIVQRSHGRIWIEATDGPGTRVVIEWPRPTAGER